MLHSAITESIGMNSHWVILYQCNFSSSDQLDISLVQCALSWDIESSNPISTSSHVLFCLLYKHLTPLQTTLKATLLRNENLPFIHQPNKVSQKASDVQQLIGDINQRILYKHFFLKIITVNFFLVKTPANSALNIFPFKSVSVQWNPVAF